jgi:hypothetical protein
MLLLVGRFACSLGRSTADWLLSYTCQDLTKHQSDRSQRNIEATKIRMRNLFAIRSRTAYVLILLYAETPHPPSPGKPVPFESSVKKIY